MENTMARPCDDPTTQQNTKEVEQRSHDHRQLRTHCTGIDHGCDSIGCVMEAVNCFVEQHKSQSKQ